MPSFTTRVCTRATCHLLALLLLARLGAAHDCVSLFERNITSFDVCKTSECFIFRTEIPFVFMDPWMNKTEHQRPFLCRERGSLYSELRGPFFDIVDELPPLKDAYCVWGGTNCTFDDKIKFVQRNADKYRFIAGGLLFLLEYRMDFRSIPSAPLMEDRLVVIGPRDDDRASWANAWESLWRPFTTQAWVMLSFTCVFMVIMRVWISWFFTVPFNWHRFRDNLIGDYHHHYRRKRRRRANRDDARSAGGAETPTQSQSTLLSRASTMNRYHHHHPLRVEQEQPALRDERIAAHKDPAELRRLNMYLANGGKLLFVIVILYYEISVVDFVFEDRRDELDNIDPRKFVITRNSTMDRFLQGTYGNTSRIRRGSCQAPCWKQVANISRVYDTVTDKSSRHRFSAVYEVFNRYYFKRNGSLCATMQVLDNKDLSRHFAGVWYYSSNISLARRTAIDQAIVKLRELGKIRKLIYKETGARLPPNCESSTSISVLVLFVPLVCFPGPIFACVFWYMFLYSIRRQGLMAPDPDLDHSDTDSDNSPPPPDDRPKLRKPEDPYLSAVSASADSVDSSTLELIDRTRQEQYYQNRLALR